MDCCSGERPELSIEDLLPAARRDFGIFVELAFPVLHGGQALVHADYLDLVVALLTRVREGKYPRLVINLPPGYMKSMLVSVMYVAWRLGVDPTWKVVCISYGDDLAHRLSVLTRTLMSSTLYRATFPGTVLEKKAEDQLTTTQGGYRYATQVHSDITGFRPRDIIIDDPIEPEDGTRELVKEKLRSWVESSVKPRLEDPPTGSIILVMHRVAPDDLSATFIQQGAYCLPLPLIAETVEKYIYKNQVIFHRQPGDRLNPSRTTAEEVERLRLETPPRVWEPLYQQRPRLGGSGMLSLARLSRYQELPTAELIIHSWDIGATITGNASVCTKWGVARDPDGKDVAFLFDVIKMKVELPDVRAAIKAQDMIDKPDLIIVDHRGAGIGVYQDLRRSGYGHVFEAGTSADSLDSKIDRFGSASLAFYDGNVAFPESACWLDELHYDLATFPELKEFDLIDSITQFVAYMPTALMYARQKHRPNALG